ALRTLLCASVLRETDGAAYHRTLSAPPTPSSTAPAPDYPERSDLRQEIGPAGPRRVRVRGRLPRRPQATRTITHPQFQPPIRQPPPRQLPRPIRQRTHLPQEVRPAGPRRVRVRGRLPRRPQATRTITHPQFQPPIRQR